MKFPLKRFKEFCAKLTIDSKEKGQIFLSWQNMLGTQRYFVTRIAAAMERGVHYFVILKGRQEGITTVCAALDLFWHYNHKGMQGTFAAHNEEARDNFRKMLSNYHNGLPKAFRVPLIQNNRYFLSFKNRASIAMQIGGGVKGKGTKGRGQAFTFIHGTECSSWEDEESLASILASLAQQNPNRLQIFESTARGMNIFKDMWDDAQEATTQEAIFIGWWLNEFYRKEKDSNEYRVYWDGKLTPKESDWVKVVKLKYDFDIQPEQIAWWRWMAAEQIHDDNLMLQEFPPHEDLAFILTGKNFFSLSMVQEMAARIDAEEDPSYWRFSFGDEFVKTEVEQCIPSQAHLRVWEEPDDQGIYSIGCDCAYGSSITADRSVVEIYRCYADRFEQVAEFCTPEITTYKFAWVICALAGYYKNSMVNVELNGPGEAVLGEMDNLRRQASMIAGERQGDTLRSILGHMRYFLYKKLDSIGSGSAYMWKTTHETKDQAFNNFRSILEKGHGVIHSKLLADEMKIIVREDDGYLGASGKKKDDCAMASAIASENYQRYIWIKCKQSGMTWNKENLRRTKAREVGREPTPVEAAINRSVGHYMHAIGVKYGPQ